MAHSNRMGTETKNRVEEFGNTASERAKEMGSSVAESIKDTTSKVADSAAKAVDSAQETVSNVAQRASDAACAVGQRAEDATQAVGSGMESLGHTIHEYGAHNKYLAPAATVGSTLESGGRYIRQEGLSGMGEDLTMLIRRNPIPSLFVGLCLGFLVGRSMRS